MNYSSGPSTSRLKEKTNQNIQVYVRVRPLNSRERGIRSAEVVEALPKEIVVRYSHDSKMTKKFTFDRAFGTDSKQCEVYHTVVAPLIEEVLSGYNCTVFAYGQTGTGKTHTMIGTECPELKSSWEDETMVGIIPRALSHLFDELRLMELEYTMRISYLELYNEELCDLLSTDDNLKIRIFDDAMKKGSVIIQGLEEIIVHSKNDVYKLLEKGKERRKTATTLMNAQSSRSHTVFSILVHIKESGIGGEEMLKIGKLNLVDLAGSENISKAGNEKGIRARETVNINQSLLTLGRVITALVERTPHIPYRESKLTRLLQESLGGRTKTSIIATISPGHKDLDETLSTLDYAHRAKNIQNKPELNQKLTKKTVLKEYTEEIDRLKRELMAARDKNGIFLPEETYNDMHYKLDCQNKELNEKIMLIKLLKDEMLNKEKIFNEVSLNLVEKTEQLQKTESVLHETKSTLDQTKKVLTTTKRRYKEKKVLLNNHVKTEEKLTGQANTLLQVADKATEEHLKLQDTLERRKDVDNKIETVSGQFKEKMLISFNSMTKETDDLYKNHDSISSVLKDEMKNNMELHKNFSIKTINNIDKISKSRENSYIDIKTCINKYSEKFTNLSKSNKELLNTMFDDLKSVEMQRCNDLKNQFNNISQRISEQKGIQEEHNNFVLKLLDLTKTSINDYTESTQNKLTETSVKLRNYFKESISQICTFVESVNGRTEKNHNKLLEIKKMIDELEQDNTEYYDSSKQILVNIVSDKTKADSDFDMEIRQSMKNNNDFKVNLNNDFSTFEKNTYNLQNDYNEKFSLSNKEIDNNTITTDNFCTERLQFINKLTKTTEENNKNEVNLLQSHEENVINEIEVANISQKDDCESVKKYVTEECNRIKNLTLQHESLVHSLDTNIEKYSNNYKENSLLCHENLNNFHESDLKTYKSTGETPNRKNFLYPRILASTSPHENIVKRFRIENQWSDTDSTILEDTGNITVTDLSDYFIPINSTPIKESSNYDNMKNLHNSDRIILSTIEKQVTMTQSVNDNSIVDFEPSSSVKNLTSVSNFEENKENFS